MSKSRFINKFIAPLALIVLTPIGAHMIYSVYLVIKVALAAESSGYGSSLAIHYFATDVEYHKWHHGRATIADLRYLAEVRLEAIRQSNQEY